MGRFCNLTLILASLASTSIIAADDKPPCYEQWTCTNGKDVGPVVDEQSCLDACFACEGGY